MEKNKIKFWFVNISEMVILYVETHPCPIFVGIDPWKFGQKQFTTHKFNKSLFTNSKFTNHEVTIYKFQIHKFQIHKFQIQIETHPCSIFVGINPWKFGEKQFSTHKFNKSLFTNSKFTNVKFPNSIFPNSKFKLRSFTSALRGFFWLLSHVIYLKLTRELQECLLSQASIFEW